MKRIFSSPLLHPIFFAADPVIFLFAENIKTLQALDLVIPLIFVETFALLLLFLLRLVYKDLHKAALITSYLLVIILSYLYIYEFLGSTIVASVLRESHLAFSLFLIGLGIFISYKIFRSPRRFHSLTSILTVVSFSLLLFPVIKIIQFHISYSSSGPGYSVNLPLKKTTVKNRPDIYYLIFDRYARGDSLQEFYDYDNSPFLEYLRSKGFYIATQSQANYISTDLSLGSSLNGVHLADFISEVGSTSGNLRPLNQMLENHAMMRFLKDQGYTYIHLGSWWSPTSLNRYADRNINILSLSEFGESLYSNSILSPLTEHFDIPIFNTRFTNWKRIVYQFEELNKIPSEDGPTFVFSHFLLPHPPYVFDEHGSFLSESEARARDNKTNYVGQVKYTNSQLEKLVDTILKNTKGPKPIIIIQADEGPYPKRYDKEKQTFDWSDATSQERKEKMQILNAYYFPQGGDKLLYPSLSPANTLRTILNYYFGQSLPYLQNTSYFSNKGKPYFFTYQEEATSSSSIPQ